MPPPGSRHHTSWVKVKNLIIISSGVRWSEAINTVVWGAQNVSRVTCFCLFIHAISFYQAACPCSRRKPHIRYLETWVPVLPFASQVISFVKLGMATLPRDLLCGLNGSRAREGICYVKPRLRNVDGCGCS